MGFGPGPSGIIQLQDLFQRALNLSVGFALLAMTIMLVVAGFRYLMSAGQPGELSNISKSITWALLGILFLALAWLVLKLIGVFTGVDVTHFCLGFPRAPTNCP